MSDAVPFHFTIAAAPEFDSADEFTLKSELRLVKIGLLYADRAQLYSPGTSMVVQLRKHRDARSDEERREHVVGYLTRRVLTDPGGDVGRQFPRLQMYLRGETDPARRTAVVRSTMHAHTMPTAVDDDLWEKTGTELWEFARRAGTDEILEAVDSGLLELHEFEGDAGMGWADNSPERGFRKALEFMEAVSGAIVDRTTYPVFDADAAAIAREAVALRLVPPSEAQLRRGRHAGLAAGVLGMLPTFEAASVDEVLDVRREISGALAGFRGAMSKFSAEMGSEPWGEDFGLEVEEAFVREVEPKVDEIRELVKANSSLATLARKVGNPKAVATGLGVLLAGLPVLPAVAAVALGAGLTSGLALYDIHKEWAVEQEKARTNQMFFYYQAEEAFRRRA